MGAAMAANEGGGRGGLGVGIVGPKGRWRRRGGSKLDWPWGRWGWWPPVGVGRDAGGGGGAGGRMVTLP